MGMLGGAHHMLALPSPPNLSGILPSPTSKSESSISKSTKAPSY